MTAGMNAFNSKRTKKANHAEIKLNRKVQDSVFRDLFHIKENSLDLYETLHPDDMTVKIDDIKNITLSSIVAGGIFNDLGLLVGKRLIILAEHQSTLNRNMPVRTLLYYGDTLKNYLFGSKEKKKQLYQSKLLKLPSPEFYMIYTGDSKAFHEEKLLLSNAFDRAGFLELKVKCIFPEDVSDTSVLGQYFQFVGRLKNNRAFYSKEEAIAKTVASCIKDNILKEYLKGKEGEVAAMLMNEMRIEEIVGTAEENRRIGRREGREQGRKQGRKETALAVAKELKKENLSNEMIARVTKLPIDKINSL